VNKLTDTINFNSKKHSYTKGRGKNKIEFTGVTSFVKKFFPPFDEDKASQLSFYKRRREDPSITPSKIRKEWKATRDNGTAVHKEIHEYINGTRDLTNDNNPRSVAAYNFYDSLLSKYSSCEVHPEQVVYSEELKIAGTVDLVVDLGDNTLILVDWKTNAQIRQEAYKGETGLGVCSDLPNTNYSHYTLQLSLYAYILERDYGYTVDKLYLVHLMEDRFEPYRIQYRKDKILEMVNSQ
jgi:hypothetical protein